MTVEHGHRHLVTALGIDDAEVAASRCVSSQCRSPGVRAGLERMGVSTAVVFPIQVLTHGDPNATRRAITIAGNTPGVHAVLAPATSSFRQGQDSLISVIPTAEGNTSAGTATVTRLRAALTLAAIAIVTFLLLARAFRSVVLAAKAVPVNLVSLGASFGFLVLFRQNGHGSNVIYGVPATGSIRNWIPIISFAFLFGISMDHEVFILARNA
jgi:RND superfamily putative drug exporter